MPAKEDSTFPKKAPKVHLGFEKADLDEDLSF